MNRIHGAFIHARYSTDNQNPDTIEVQVQKCTEWCNRNAIPILGIFADEAMSGMCENRPQYLAMIEQMKMGLADTVVIYDQSRMFRKMTAWFDFRDQMTALGVKVVSVTQPTIGQDLRDPANFITEGSMALFNQMHVLITRQKVMAKMRFMATNGQHTGGKPALGYRVENGRLVICEEEAAIVRRIFQEYASGMSYREIIAGLNRDGLKTKRGNSFGANSLHDLLKNEKYIGTLVYGASPYREDGTRNTHAKDGEEVIRIEDAIPAIIDKTLFQKVQEKLSQNKRQQGGRPATRRDYPLKGKVFCGYCKSAMTVSISKKNYTYYKCCGKKRTHQCEASPISVEVLEASVLDMLRQTLGHPETVENLISILREQSGAIVDSAAQSMSRLVAERTELNRKLSNAMDAVMNGLHSQALAAKMAELESRIAVIDAQANSLKNSVDAAVIPEARLREILDMIINDPTNNALLSLVYRVEVYEDRFVIWTIFDADPSGDIDISVDGVRITPGIPFGVPTVFVTTQFLRIVMSRKNTS